MRLVDADALVNVVETARKKAKTLTGMDFVMVTKSQPIIDAIPVEWLNEMKRCAAADGDNECVYVIVYLLDRWQKEQEAQDAKM